MDMPPFRPLRPRVVLGIAAHPDDLDFAAAGTAAKFAAAGAAVYYLLLTDGSKGTSDQTLSPAALARNRAQEQRAACRAVGGREVFFLGYPDGELEVTPALKKEIVKVIRTVRPDVVITMDPTMVYSARRGLINHPDHRAAGQATLDAVYPLARDHLAYPDLFTTGYKPYKVRTVLLANFDQCNYYVDISGTLEVKLAAIAAHASQTTGLPKEQEIIALAAEAGKAAGHRYAEGFVRIDIR